MNYANQTGKMPADYELQSINEQVWNQFVFENAYTPEFQKLGLSVSDEEQIDMVQGKNIHPSIQQVFVNQETVLRYLKKMHIDWQNAPAKYR